MKIKAIITGATGMIGEGVLHECINFEGVESILLLTRKSTGVIHPKLKESKLDNFYSLSGIKNQLSGYNACFFCLGTTSVGKKEEEYKRITFDLTKIFADTLFELNPGMVFCYVSGAGTDSSETGKLMWAKVKGKTENYLLNKGFHNVFIFRPALILPAKGFKNTLKVYKIFNPLLRIVKVFFPNYFCSLNEISTAMINSVIKGYTKNILEVVDIKILGRK